MHITPSTLMSCVTLVLIAVQTCAAVSDEGTAGARPWYDVRISLSSKSCIRCCSSLLAVKRENLGVVGSRLDITVVSQNARILKQVRELIRDTTLVQVRLEGTQLSNLDAVTVSCSGASESLATFDLPDDCLRVIPYLDSIDAAATAIKVDTSQWEREIPLRTRILFDEELRVHTHDDRSTVSIAATDRAMVVTTDTALVFPQYFSGMDAVDRAKPMLPTRAVVLSPTHVRYRFVMLLSPLDTVINGEQAKLYTKVQSMVSDVYLAPFVRNDVRQQLEEASILGEWASCDTAVVTVVDPSGPDGGMPHEFWFSTIPVAVPVRFFPMNVSLCDAIGDTVYACSPTEGWIRLTSDGTMLLMPPPTAVTREAVLARCVAFPGSVLLSVYDPDSEDRLCSMLLTSNGVRVSPPVWHSTRTIIAPVLRDDRPALEAFHRSENNVLRQVVWKAAP